jgi:hypothetical protein
MMVPSAQLVELVCEQKKQQLQVSEYDSDNHSITHEQLHKRLSRQVHVSGQKQHADLLLI